MKQHLRQSKRSKIHVGPTRIGTTRSPIVKKHNKETHKSRGRNRSRHGLRLSSLSVSCETRVPENAVFHSGRWTKSECEAFERGIQMYGKGKWTLIATLIPTRSSVQVKSHAQAIYGRCDRSQTSKHRQSHRHCHRHSKSSNIHYSNDMGNDDINDTIDMDNDDYSTDNDIDPRDDSISLAARNLLYVAHSKVWKNLNDDDDKYYWNVTNTTCSSTTPSRSSKSSCSSSPSQWSRRIQPTIVVLPSDIRASTLTREPNDAFMMKSSKTKDTQHAKKIVFHTPSLVQHVDDSHVVMKDNTTNTPISNSAGTTSIPCVISTPVAARVTPTEDHRHDHHHHHATHQQYTRMQDTPNKNDDHENDDNYKDENDDNDFDILPQFHHGEFYSIRVSPMKRVYNKYQKSFQITNYTTRKDDDENKDIDDTKKDEYPLLTHPIVRPMVHQHQCITKSPMDVGLVDSSLSLQSKHKLIHFSPTMIENDANKVIHSTSCFKKKCQKSATSYGKMSTISNHDELMTKDYTISFRSKEYDMAHNDDDDDGIESYEKSAAAILQYMSSCI